MKRLLHFTIALAMLVATSTVYAQQIVATGGGTFQSENLTLSYTIGEPVIETFTGENLTLTQGFQQPYNFYLQQVLNIPMGWSGVSTWLDPIDKDVDGLFMPVENDLIFLSNLYGNMFYPAEEINTIGNWNYFDGYQLKAANDFELTVSGTKIPSSELEISEGWNLIPVLSSCEADVEDLFTGFTGLQIVKQVAGTNLYWPAYNINTLLSLQPGKAYYLATEVSGNINFPECTKSSTVSEPVQKPINISPWNDLNYSALSHVVAFPAFVFENSDIKFGDIIGAFTLDGICAGRQEIQNTQTNIALTIFGDDDLTTEIDGFESAEPFLFKIYRPEADEVFDLEVNYDLLLPNAGYFATHGISAVSSLKVQATGILENDRISMEVYPNPSQGIFNIHISKALENPTVQITDFRGSLIKEIQVGITKSGEILQINLNEFPNGVYFLRLMDEGFVGMEKIINQ
jgi:hypothetical protein